MFPESPVITNVNNKMKCMIPITRLYIISVKSDPETLWVRRWWLCFYNDENKIKRPKDKCKEEKKALHLWGARPVIFAAVVPSAALSGHLSSAGFSQSLKAPWAQRQWSTWQNAHNCVYLQGTTPEKAQRNRPRAKPAFISRLCTFIFSSTGCTQLLRIALICKISEVSSSNDLKGADSWTSLQLSGLGLLY